jgi:hypothetical protein
MKFLDLLKAGATMRNQKRAVQQGSPQKNVFERDAAIIFFRGSMSRVRVRL